MKNFDNKKSLFNSEDDNNKTDEENKNNKNQTHYVANLAIWLMISILTQPTYNLPLQVWI